MPGGARVFGLMVVRNAADLIRVNLRHHLDHGLERILVVDNGSADGTRERLGALADTLPIEVSDHPGPFDQAQLVNALAVRAREQGADWLLPIDADEFFVADGGALAAVLERCDDAAVRVEVVNFVQRRRRQRPSERGLLLMDHRPARTIEQRDARLHVDAGEWALVEIDWHPNTIVRARENIWIRPGSHEVDGLDGPAAVTPDIVCLHAPLRARAAIGERVEHGERLDDAGQPSEVGWQNRDAALTDADAEVIWRANSNRRGLLEVGGEPRRLVADSRLRDAVAPYVPGRARAAIDAIKGTIG